MCRWLSAVVIFVAVLWFTSPVAQTPDASFPPMRVLAPTSGTGLANAELIARPEVRLIRVDVEPGGVRVLHTHDDVKYHLVVPITGPLEVNLDAPNPVSLVPWQPHYMTGGTRHGFRNKGTSKVSVMEIFVRQ